MHRSEALDANNSAAVEAKESPFVRAGFDPKELMQLTQVKFDGDKVLVQDTKPAAPQQEETTPAGKLMKETTDAAHKELADRKAKNGTLGEKDLQEVMPKYYPKMKEAITLADTQAAGARKTAADEYLKVRTDLQTFSTAFPKAMERFGNASNAVPEKDGEHVGKLLSELTGEKTSDARKAAIRKDLSKYPDLADSAETVAKMSHDAAAKFGPLEKAVNDMRVGLAQGLEYRGFYKQTLIQSGGAQAEIDRVSKEGEAEAQIFIRAMQAPGLLFMPPEDLQPKKPLPPVYKA